MKRKTIEDCHQIALKLNGKCLSTEYKTAYTKYKWECCYGHTWDSVYSSVNAGHWCPKCNKNARLTIDELKIVAENKGGKCLALTLKNSEEKILWECSKGHTWLAQAGKVHRGGWCPKCEGLGSTIEDMQNLAISKGGKCLSTIYKSVKHELQWECEKGHIWLAIPESIKRGTWCPNCFSKNTTIDDLNKLANDRGGICLSETFKTKKDMYMWKCKYEHIFEKQYNSVVNGYWCPKCASSKYLFEEIVRYYFETIFNCNFQSIRPKWLKNEKVKRTLQLDGYNENLKIAFEYNGIQHYEICKYADTEEKLNKIKERDAIKQEICSKNNVKLIVIPTLQDKLKLENLASFIKEECIKQNINLPENYDSIVFDHNSVYTNSNKEYKNNILKEYAKTKGGICLSEYGGYHIPINFKCKKNHEFSLVMSLIIKGSWCPFCVGRRRTYEKI